MLNVNVAKLQKKTQKTKHKLIEKTSWIYVENK